MGNRPICTVFTLPYFLFLFLFTYSTRVYTIFCFLRLQGCWFPRPPFRATYVCPTRRILYSQLMNSKIHLRCFSISLLSPVLSHARARKETSVPPLSDIISIVFPYYLFQKCVGLFNTLKLFKLLHIIIIMRYIIFRVVKFFYLSSYEMLPNASNSCQLHIISNSYIRRNYASDIFDQPSYFVDDYFVVTYFLPMSCHLL